MILGNGLSSLWPTTSKVKELYVNITETEKESRKRCAIDGCKGKAEETYMTAASPSAANGYRHSIPIKVCSNCFHLLSNGLRP